MFVIDGVVLKIAEQIGKIGRFDYENAAILKKVVDTLDERVEVVDMGKNISRRDDGRMALLADDLVRDIRREKSGQGWDTALFCDPRDVRGWIDATNP